MKNSGGNGRHAYPESRVGVRHRPPKELRDNSVTLALAAGADVYYVASQHGHSVEMMMKNYAGWMSNADLGRNRAAINPAADAPKTSDSAVEPQQV